MTNVSERAVADHYGIENLRLRIFDAMVASGLDLGKLRPSDLAPIDEFHMGGRAATADIISKVGITSHDTVLDIGSGLGGLVRYVASEIGCPVIGIDLTPEYVDLARELTELTGLAERASFITASAVALPFGEDFFTAALTFHVGMNIADRHAKYREAFRVLRPGGKLVIYDVLKGPEPGMRFPVPWADSEATSFLVTMDEQRSLLKASGFTILEEEDRTPTVLKHHRARVAELSADAPPPPLGLHLLQGTSAKLKSRNMIEMAEAGQIALGLVIAQKPE